jgi:hypothetical protein
MLSLKGAGADTPNGATAQFQNSAESASRAGLSSASRRLIDAQILRKETQASLNSAQAGKAAAETREVTARAGIGEFDLEERNYLKTWYKSFDMKGQRMSAETVISLGDEARSRHDVQIMNELTQLAKRYGYSTFEGAAHDKEFQMALKRLVLTGDLIPKSNAEAAFYRTDFGKDIAPYMGSAESLGRIVSEVAGAARPYQFDRRYGRKK